MPMAWLTQWWTILATVLVVFVPGLAAAWAIGLRRLGAWAFAPVGSIAIIALVATAYGFLHIPWTLPSAVLGLSVVAAALVGCRRLFRIPPVRTRVVGERWPVLVALVAAAALLTVRVTVYIGDPSNFSQTTDAIFHLSAVREILEHANASPWGLAALVDPSAGLGFYPAGWHAADSLVAMLAGDIVVSTNVLALIVAAVVWPLGIAWLAQVALRRRLAAAAAAAMTPVLVIFPLTLLQYGVLYPYLLAVALLPAAIAVVVATTSRSGRLPAGPVAGRLSLVLGCGVSVAALAISHPTVVLAWGLALWLYAVGVFTVRRGRVAAGGAWGEAAVLLVALVVLAVVWLVFERQVTADTWGPAQSGRRMLEDVLGTGWMKTPPVWWVSGLVVIGLIAVLRRPRWRWLAFGWLAFVLLAFVAGAMRNESIRVLLVGPWYSDPYRLAALVPVMILPVAAAGVILIADLAVAVAVRGRRTRPSLARGWIEGVTIGLLLGIGTLTVAAQPLVLRFLTKEGVVEDASPYWVSERSWLDSDERTLLSRMPGEVPAGVTVLSNPGTGAAFGRFLTGVDVYPPRRGVPDDARYTLLKHRLKEVTSSNLVCEAVRGLGAGYVLDFGPGDEGFGRVEKMPGFTGFDGVPGFELVDREGAASLWRITACR